MTLLCGIYGYEITKPIEIGDIKIIPRSTSYFEVTEWARNLDTYHLTAVVQMELFSHERLLDLEAVLSFIEHLDVIVTRPIDLESSGNLFDQFPIRLNGHVRYNGGGSVILGDAFSTNSRLDFIKAATTKLDDKDFCELTKFRSAFFKCVEVFRSPKSFLDVRYYLLFSGIESFARGTLGDSTPNASTPISKLLQSYGFDIQIENPACLPRAVSTYTHLRNALFHNSELEKEVNMNGRLVLLKLADYYSYFKLLVPLVMMKAVNFDDNHIHWDSWIDRQPFK